MTDGSECEAPKERIKHFKEFHTPLSKEEQELQGARCMACGVPFCQAGQMIAGMASGCPLHNLVPEWNDLIYHGNWEEAYYRLKKTNNFPEFTSRVCPALCEAACTCGLHGEPCARRQMNMRLLKMLTRRVCKGKTAESTYRKEGSDHRIRSVRTCCADQLNKRGHQVTVFEREDKPGGLLRYGIPNMKLEKQFIDRKIAVMEEEGIRFDLAAMLEKIRKRQSF